MTVQHLIEKLQEFPLDSEVIWSIDQDGSAFSEESGYIGESSYIEHDDGDIEILSGGDGGIPCVVIYL